MATRDSFCSYCGTAFAPPLAYPRTCAGCKTTIWANPIPVSVVLLPVVRDHKTGLLVIRRGIPPIGKLALVGGFLEEHETWQVGGVREMREETGVTINDASTLEPFWFTSTEPLPNRVLLFSLAKEVQASELAPFAPDHETTERGLVFGPNGLGDVFAFPLHVEAARRFFAARGISGDHAFSPI